MNCPKCNQAKFYPQTGCEVCQFSADPLLLDELNHIDWLLAEIQTWGGEELKIQISEKYQARKQQIEIELELRLPPFSAAEAPDAWMRLFQIEVLEKKLKKWLWQDALKPGIFQQLDDQLKSRIMNFTNGLQVSKSQKFLIMMSSGWIPSISSSIRLKAGTRKNFLIQRHPKRKPCNPYLTNEKTWKSG